MGTSRAARRRVRGLSKVGARAGIRLRLFRPEHMGTGVRARKEVHPAMCPRRRDQSALGWREIRQRAFGCDDDEARQPGQGLPPRPSRAAQQGADQGSRRATTGAFAMSGSRTHSYEEPVGGAGR